MSVRPPARNSWAPTAWISMQFDIRVTRFVIPVVFYEITNVQCVYWSDSCICVQCVYWSDTAVSVYSVCTGLTQLYLCTVCVLV